MDNNEITEERLIQLGWRKIGNSFYNHGRAITHFDGKFQAWADGKHSIVKTTNEIQIFTSQDTKKPG
jgi:hypothetical protein